MRLAMFQPDIPQNLGAATRLTACMGIDLDVIKPAAFPLGTAEMRRAAMDYGDIARIRVHDSWAAFLESRQQARLILLTTRGATGIYDFCFRADDILLLGRESAGVPEDVHELADHRVTIPMAAGARSLNVVIAGAMAVGEAIRQTGFGSHQLP